MADADREQIECGTHGPAFKTYICEHLADNPEQVWFSEAPSAENEWPDAWCTLCHEAYKRENQWNEKNEGTPRIKLFCHCCYETRRARATHVDV
jgi:hypothetical protein